MTRGRAYRDKLFAQLDEQLAILRIIRSRLRIRQADARLRRYARAGRSRIRTKDGAWDRRRCVAGLLRKAWSRIPGNGAR